MKQLIDHNIEYLTNLTKEEADFIEHVLKWDNDQKAAFLLAKKIFEDKENADKSQAE